MQRSVEANGGQTNPQAFQTPASLNSNGGGGGGGGAGSDPTRTGSTESPEQHLIPGIPAATGHTFGVDLSEQLLRDGTEVPLVVEKCAEAIEAFGK